MRSLKVRGLRLYLLIKNLLDLKYDFDEQGTYEAIKSGVDFKSGNAWSLIFAIFIASIGLNVNSNAVIIGAMLISPLMGPIVGAGYSLGTHNFDLLRKSVKNLSYAIVISITASALFFLISPHGADHSELLARTQPTFFDAMIAFFGGAAGIVASTRKIKGNAIPGVAIATALMPPLCTVGYGIANFEISYIIGALYLFAINSTFILISTYLFVRLLNFKFVYDRNPQRDILIHRYMTWVSVIIILPSIYMAWYLHKKIQFENSVAIFFEQEMKFSNSLIATKEINFNLSHPTIKVKIFGEPITENHKMFLQSNLNRVKSLSQARLFIEYVGQDLLRNDELEDKFIKRNEFSQLLRKENSKLLKLEQDKADEITRRINKLSGQDIGKIHIHNNKVEFVWRKRPSREIVKTAERISYEVISEKSLLFQHSLVF